MKAKALAFKERLSLENGFRTISNSILWAHIGNHTGLRNIIYITPFPEIRYSDLSFSAYICWLRTKGSPMSDEFINEIEETCEFIDLIISVSSTQFSNKVKCLDGA